MYNATATNVWAYVIDTGIAAGNNDFRGRASNVYDALGGNGSDCNGHGTHVAGTIGGTTYGVAKGVRLLGVRVLNCSGSGSVSGIINALNWVRSDTAHRPAVANMSLGGGFSSSLNTATANLANSGVFVAVAAGNSAANACNSSPASTSAAYTAAASDRSDRRASFSNYGSCVDGYAPGVSVTSDWYTGGTATLSGTSMASPHVAGAAAVYLEANPGATPAQVASALSAAATTGKVTSPGSGSPNRLLYSAPPGGGGTNPPPTDTCGPGTITDTGSLTGTGSVAYAPSGGSYTTTVSGVHRGCFSGTGRDFDLYLQKLSGSTWSTVARSEGSASTEQISYSGIAGTYRWRIYSYNGAGTFTLNWSRP
jgi:subtilisin family serine protease